MITTSKLSGGRRRVSIKLGMAWGAMFHSPACLSLAIRKAPRLGASALKSCDLPDRELVGRHLAARRIVDHVLTHPESLDDRRVGRAPFDLVPVAREILRRVDEHRPAAVLDAPERVDLGGEQVLRSPDRDAREKAAEAGILPRGRSP